MRPLRNRGGRAYPSNAWGQAITVTVTVIACIVVFVVGAPGKWLAAIYATVGTFGGMISFFRPRWASTRFWIIMGAAFGIHLAVTGLVFGVALRERSELGFLVTLPFIVAESFILYHAVRFLDKET